MSFQFSTQQYSGNSLGKVNLNSTRVKGGFSKSHSKDITIGSKKVNSNSIYNNTINGSMAEQAYYELNKRYSR